MAANWNIAELTDKGRDGNQSIILWLDGAAVASLKLEAWAVGLEPWMREMLMAKILDVFVDEIASRKSLEPKEAD